jgi:hypothetical protein
MIGLGVALMRNPGDTGVAEPAGAVLEPAVR